MNYERLGVPRVINAAGRLTALGGSALSPEVVAAIGEGARWNVDLDSLKDRAGELIARWTGAAGAMVTTGAAAGIAIMSAAVVAGDDPFRIRQLPVADWDRREILIQAGHAIHFGAPVVQMIRLGGGAPVTVGDANHVTQAELVGSFNHRTAGLLYVQSHHCVQKGMQSLQACAQACRSQGVPLLVDAAAEEDLEAYIAAGADMVTYSGGKAFGGPTSGIIAGRRDLILACRLQEGGVARAMKVGKEVILGLLSALEAYCARDIATERQRQLDLIAALEAGLTGLPHTLISRLPDEAGREIVRLGLTLDERTLGFTAVELLSRLRSGSPAVELRSHWASGGTVAIDPRPIQMADVPEIVTSLWNAYVPPRGRPQ